MHASSYSLPRILINICVHARFIILLCENIHKVVGILEPNPHLVGSVSIHVFITMLEDQTAVRGKRRFSSVLF